MTIGNWQTSAEVFELQREMHYLRQLAELLQGDPDDAEWRARERWRTTPISPMQAIVDERVSIARRATKALEDAGLLTLSRSASEEESDAQGSAAEAEDDHARRLDDGG